MKYIRQFGIILMVSFVAEGLRALLPLPIPASIYGLALMFWRSKSASSRCTPCSRRGIFS